MVTKMTKPLRLLSALVVILSVSLVSASVSCDTIDDVEYVSGVLTSLSSSFQCTNSLESSSVTLTKGGSASPYFTLSESTIGFSTNITETKKTFTLDFDESAPEGTYIGTISFSDGSPSLSFLLKVEPPASQGG